MEPWTANKLLACCGFPMCEYEAQINIRHNRNDHSTYFCNHTTCTSITPSSATTIAKCSIVDTSVCDGQCTSTITTTTIAFYSPTTNSSIVSTSYGGGRHCTSTITTTITPSFSPESTAENLTSLGPTHGGYIAVILVLLAIIITLVVLVGYLVRRTTAQRGTVQTTEQPPTDMAASDYLEPVALRQLQTNARTGNHQ